MLDQLTLKEMLRYDPETGIFIWLKPLKYCSRVLLQPAGYPHLGRNNKSYHVICVAGRYYRRAHLAWLYMTGAWPEDVIDHINGDSLDDRWSNLRAATQHQNMWNIKKRAKASDFPMGVGQTKGSRKFQAHIGVNGKQLHLGSFETPEQASDAYQQARREHFGEFA